MKEAIKRLENMKHEAMVLYSILSDHSGYENKTIELLAHIDVLDTWIEGIKEDMKDD